MQTILLIENDPANLVAQSLLLHCFSYTVLEASNEGEAWFASQQHEGPIHLVMLKAVLENHSSTEFVARLQLVYPQICALLVCDISPVELADMPCEYTFVQKPFRAETLAYTIRGLLQNPRNRASFLFVTKSAKITQWPYLVIAASANEWHCIGRCVCSGSLKGNQSKAPPKISAAKASIASPKSRSNLASVCNARSSFQPLSAWNHRWCLNAT